MLRRIKKHYKGLLIAVLAFLVVSPLLAKTFSVVIARYFEVNRQLTFASAAKTKGDIVPLSDSADDLGTSALRFQDGYFDSVDVSIRLNAGSSMRVDGSLTSETDGTDNLGSSSVRWLDVFADSVDVNISVNLGSSATFDGNIISETDGTDDLGSASVRFDQVYTDELFWNKGDTVASAASSFSLGADGNYYVISGTATIDSIAAQTVGKFVILQTAAACTLADGGNLKLAGPLNATADDIISLICDGTNWHEVSRSVN